MNPFQLVDRFNTWYDNLPGGPRFAFFMSLMLMAIVPLEFGLSLGHRGMASFGLVMMSGLTLIGVQRAVGLKRMHKLVGLLMALGLAIVAMAVIALSVVGLGALTH